jgi:primosomal replication protein N
VNRFDLSATLIEKSVKRYTPAGTPVLECQIQHDSDVSEAASVRRLNFETRVKAVGETAERLQNIALGSRLRLTGFLAPTRLHSRQLLFHITDFELE